MSGEERWLLPAGIEELLPDQADRLERLRRKYDERPQVRHLIEPRARTTFQNALLTARLIRAHGIGTVLLVTNRWHMPRSYYLLRMALAGTGVEILPCPVEAEPYGLWPTAWTTVQKKQAWNEMIEFWGSMMEMVHYKITGRLPEGNPKKNRVVGFLRGVLLFKVRAS